MEEQKVYLCLPAKTLTNVVAFLETKPYSEVAKMISEVVRNAKDCTAQVEALYNTPAPAGSPVVPSPREAVMAPMSED